MNDNKQISNVLLNNGELPASEIGIMAETRNETEIKVKEEQLYDDDQELPWHEEIQSQS